MSQRLALLYISLLLSASLAAAASDQNSSRANRIEVVITVAGMQESVRAIEKSSQHLAELTRQLSNKQDFSPKDRQLIAALTDALNRNAAAVNNIADALPKQFKEAETGINTLLENAAVNVQQTLSRSKSDLVDPTLSRIESRVVMLVLLVFALLFGLLWYGFWKVRTIVSTGSKSIGNIADALKSLERVVDKVSPAENGKPEA
jgi:hypothetical protein